MSVARQGRHCFTTSNGGEGFLFLQRLEMVQVTFLRKGAGVVAETRPSSGWMTPLLMT